MDLTVNDWSDFCHPVAGKYDFGALDRSGSNSRLGDRVLVLIAVIEKAIEKQTLTVLSLWNVPIARVLASMS
jgi:hypothetical protein